jgi:glycosyltransferase involved in cell wall biosynthesis
MRVLELIESAGRGGAENVVLELSAALQKTNQVEVLIANFRHGWLSEEAVKRGFSYTHIQTPKRFDPLLPIKIAKLIRKNKIDILHCHLVDTIFYGSIAAWLARVPCIGTEHGDVHHTQKKRFLKLKLKLASFFGCQLCAVSQYSSDALEKLVGKKVTVVGNPLSDFSSTLSREEIRKQEGWEEHDWIFIQVANLRPVKNQSLFLEGFSIFIKKLSPDEKRTPKLVFIGDGKLREALILKTNELGLANFVSFLGHKDNARELVSGADAFVLTSLSEALPMSLLEAAVAGLPCIGSAVGGIPEVLDAGRGELFQSGNVEELAACLKRVFENPMKSNLLQNFVREKFGAEVVAKQHIEIFKKVGPRVSPPAN